MKKTSIFGALFSIGLLAIAVPVGAATVTSTMGNGSSGFNDGDVLEFIPDVQAAQSGQPTPFNAGIGSDVVDESADFPVSWSHLFAPILDPIASATWTLGIFDHDSVASGNQVVSFSIEGTDFTAELNAQFEGHGGGDGEYNVYSLVLPGSIFADLADGNVSMSLALGGSGLQTALPFLGGGVSETGFNGAHLIYSELEIAPVPIPAAVWLFASALGVFGYLGKRKKTA